MVYLVLIENQNGTSSEEIQHIEIYFEMSKHEK